MCSAPQVKEANSLQAPQEWVSHVDDGAHNLNGEIMGKMQADMRLGVSQDRTIQNILETGLEVAVQIGQREDVVAFLQHHIAVSLQDDSVHRQGASLVGAEDIHRPQVLNKVNSLDDDLLAAHRERPF